MNDKKATHADRKTLRRKFWKLLLFALFLIYPSVSSVILRTYVCQDIQGVYYLEADYTEQCRTTLWYQVVYLLIPLIILYPIGIPAFFFFWIYRYRNRLAQAGIRAELGFIYDGYERRMWYFEMIDMLHKLFMTSLIAFFPYTWQLNVGMLIVVLYFITIILTKPYLSKGDDFLHLLCQVELCLLLMAGNVFNKASSYDPLMNSVLSVVLILLIILFFVVFLSTGFLVLYKQANEISWFNSHVKPTLDKCKKRFKKTKVKVTKNTIEDELDAMSVTRREQLQFQSGSEKDNLANFNLTRNELYSYTGALHDADGEEVLVGIANPLNRHFMKRGQSQARSNANLLSKEVEMSSSSPGNAVSTPSNPHNAGSVDFPSDTPSGSKAKNPELPPL